MATGIKFTAPKIVMEGVLDIENMALENSNFAEPVSIPLLLDAKSMNGKYVKVSYQEIDKEITQEDVDQLVNEEELEEIEEY